MAEDQVNVEPLPDWARQLQHRSDPNRVSSLQTAPPGAGFSRPAARDLPADPATAHRARRPPSGAARAADPQSKPAEPSYYDIPILKAPVWKWEIASYFYLGGLSAGAYLLSRAAQRFGGKEFGAVAKAGSYVALASILACPPLLIHDLGDPKRFHHMLRVWKPSSPMNLGTWAITAYSGAAASDAIRHYLQTRGNSVSSADRSKLLKLMQNGTLLLAQDAAGVPLALLVASYTGVLLSCTANPLWCKNPWLSPLFTASAISAGAEAISLALDCTSPTSAAIESPAHRVLRQVDTIAHAAEGVAMVGFQRFAGEKGAALKRGPSSKWHHLSIGALVSAELLKRIALPHSMRKGARMLSAALGLLGGFAMRWAFIFGGHDAAADPHTARLASAPRIGKV